jgi:hypothetical protein
MFNAIQFAFPATFANLQQTSEQMLGNAASQITDAKGRLSAAPALAVSNSPMAAACAGSANILEQLRELLGRQTSSVCVHPWVQGVGQGEGHIRYLSPANAVAAAANKFVDAADTRAPGESVEAIAIVITATSFKQLGEAVQQCCAVLPNPQLDLCARRALQLATLERDKVEMPVAPGNALWTSRRLASVRALGIACGALGEVVAHGRGYEAGGDAALQELSALADKKQQAITRAQTAVNSLAARFTGGEGRGVFISAKAPQQIKNELASSELDHDAPLAVCVVYAGVPGSLSVLREMLGL